MVSKPEYLSQLETLYESYKGQEVADALGVSVRQIQNYLRTISPAVPSKDVLRSIHEAYAKHKNGESILVLSNKADKDKIIELLERENKRLQKDLDLSLGELRHNILLARALAATNQNLLIELLAKQRKISIDEVVEDANKLFDGFYKSMKEEGSFAYVGK